MGDAEQRNDPPSGEAEPKASEESRSTAADVTTDRRPASVPPSQGTARRSSLRPAPADYRPSMRDPATLRPMMVVRAGDAEPTQAHLQLTAQESAQATQPPPPSSTNLEFSAQRQAAEREPAPAPACDEADFAIPPAPAVPIDLVPKSNRSAQYDNEEPLVRTQAGDSEATQLDGAAEASRGMHDDRSTGSAARGTSIAQRRTVAWRFIAVVLLGAGVLGAVLVLKSRKPEMAVRAAKPAMAITSAPVIPATATAGIASAPVEPNGSHPELAAAQDAPGKPVPPDSAGATSPASPAPPETTRVRLELKPVDAKVYIRGRELPGPPYEFDVPKDQKIAVEVVRFGFVTAKVVIDDKKPVVSFGMLRMRWRR
jgi:hypothetical protein